MKREITWYELSAYLPYGLKITADEFVSIEELSMLSETSVNIKGRGLNYGMWCDISDVKPILIPLTELNLKSRIDGDIIPLHELLRTSNFDLSKMDEDEIEGYAGQFTWYDLLCMKDFEMLCKWHFDVFGLIEDGLALNKLEYETPHQI